VRKSQSVLKVVTGPNDYVQADDAAPQNEILSPRFIWMASKEADDSTTIITHHTESQSIKWF
jgi:hypothetical protein